MISGVFPRLFGTYKEGAVLVAKFTVGGGGAAGATFTLKSLTANGTPVSNYGGLSLARTAVGIVTLTARGMASNTSNGVRDLHPVSVVHIPATPGTVTNYYDFRVAGYSESAGTVTLRTINNTGATLSGGANELTLANGDEVHVTLLVNK